MGEANDLEGLSDDDEILIAALAEGRYTHAVAGALAGVSAKTVQRRLTNPGFARAVGERRRERVNEVVGQLVGASQRAVQVLVEVLEGGDPADQLRAARMVLEYSRRYHREQVVEDELALRVRVLEDLAAEEQIRELPTVGSEPLNDDK
jgi:hypothetical protein